MTEAMQHPSEYAAILVSFSAGDRDEALRLFLDAIRKEPSFRLAPAAWLADVVRAIQNDPR